MIKVSELSAIELDYWTARAEGFDDNTMYVNVVPGTGHKHVVVYEEERGWVSGSYMNDWRRTGPLIEKWKVDLFRHDKNNWEAEAQDESICLGSTPLQAICRAVVRAAFGDEVEEVAC